MDSIHISLGAGFSATFTPEGENVSLITNFAQGFLPIYEQGEGVHKWTYSVQNHSALVFEYTGSPYILVAWRNPNNEDEWNDFDLADGDEASNNGWENLNLYQKYLEWLSEFSLAH